MAKQDKSKRQLKLNSVQDWLNKIVPSTQQFNGGATSVTSGMLLTEANVRTAPLSNNYVLLANIYRTFGFVNTIVNRPVEDAFKGGVKIVSKDLTQEQIDEVQASIVLYEDIKAIVDAIKLARLYGGSVLQLEDVENGECVFMPYDRWQTTGDKTNIIQINNKKIDTDAVTVFDGEFIPAYLRKQQSGWGSSIIEKGLRSINQYILLQNTVLEIIQQNKLDVYKLAGLNNDIVSASQDGNLQDLYAKMMVTNSLKDTHNAIVLDKEDEFARTQLSLTGVDAINKMLQQEICSAFSIPMSVLFSDIQGGLNTSDAQFDIYYDMVDSAIRQTYYNQIRHIIASRIMLTLDLEDAPVFDIEFNALIEKDEAMRQQNITNSINNVIALKSAGLLSIKEARLMLQKDVELELSDEVEDAEATNKLQNDE